MNTHVMPTGRTFVVYYLSIAIHFAVSFFPEQRFWGINWWAYVDLLPRIIGFSLALIVPLAVNGLVMRWGLRSSERKSERGDWFRSVSVIAILATAIFVLFRTRTHFLGDGYLLLSGLSHGGAIRLWNLGIHFVQSGLFELLGGSGDETALLTFQLLSYSAGLAFIVSASAFAYFFYTDYRERLAFLLVTITGGYALLFFGYVENYPLFVVVVLLFSLIGMAVERRSCNKWFILLPLLTGCVMHIFVVSLIPASGYLLFRDSALAKRFAKTKLWLRLFVIGFLVLSVVVTVFLIVEHSYFLRFSLVPFVNNRFTTEGYWLFSLNHFLDIANLLLLLLPGLPVVLIIVWSAPSKPGIAKPDSRFLLILIASALSVAILFDPKLGMPRDWDLFSFVGVPIALLTAVTLLNSGVHLSSRLKVAGLVIIMNLFVLVPRVFTQVDSEVSIALVDDYTQMDKTKNRVVSTLVIDFLNKVGKYGEADKHQSMYNSRYPQESWIVSAQRLLGTGQTNEAKDEFGRILKFDPSFYVAWANLGVAYVVLDDLDSALTCLKIADGLNPSNVNTTTNIGGVYWEMGNQELAEQYWTDAIVLNSDTLISRVYLLRLYQSQGREEEYFSTLTEIANHKNAPLEMMQLFSDYLLKQGNYDSATVILRKALARGLDSAIVRSRQKELPQLRIIAP